MKILLNRRSFRAAGLVALVLVAAALPAAAREAKPLGVIDSERIVQEYGAARDAQANYQKFLEGLELEVADREKELQRMAEEIESQRMLLGEDALRAKMTEFEGLRSDYFEFRQGVEQKAANEYKAKIQPIIDQVKLITERLGKEGGYGLILDIAGQTPLYIDNEVDLTDAVLAALVRGTED
jgi:Skp family chaperone for outer membrane proteins